MPAAPVKFACGVSPAGGGLVTGRTRVSDRPHTLHDPAARGRREVGRRVLQGEPPVSTWYS